MPVSHDSPLHNTFPAGRTNVTLCCALGIRTGSGACGDGTGMLSVSPHDTSCAGWGCCVVVFWKHNWRHCHWAMCPWILYFTLARCNSHSLSRYVQIPRVNSCLESRCTWQGNVRGATLPRRTCHEATSKPRNQYQTRNGIWGISAGHLHPSGDTLKYDSHFSRYRCVSRVCGVCKHL
jgi:hypothetical protein